MKRMKTEWKEGVARVNLTSCMRPYMMSVVLLPPVERTRRSMARHGAESAARAATRAGFSEIIVPFVCVGPFTKAKRSRP